MVASLKAFSAAEVQTVQRMLAHRVAQKMGSKMEEDDWTSVYCSAKGIPAQTWSNLSIDVVHGSLGVEHKMLCYRSKPSLLEACGTRLMHPAATRSLRLPTDSEDPQKVMVNILNQYADLLEQRKESIANSAGVPVSMVDLRTGWLLWQVSLREFLYFEEPTESPSPADYYAEWVEKETTGARKGSRNLWIYERSTGIKRFSLTTAAGIKLQPYFDVPGARDENLYHWTVIGESLDFGEVRIWLTSRTANELRKLAGSLNKNDVSSLIIESLEYADFGKESLQPIAQEEVAIGVVLTDEAYTALGSHFTSTNDDHLLQRFVEVTGSM